MARFAQLDGNCYLGVNLVVDRKNVARIYELVARMKEIGVDSVKVGNCIVSNDMNENNEYHQPIFKEAREQVERAAADLAGDEFELFDCYHQLDVRFEKHYSWCPYLQILPVIGADQNVYACHDKAYNLDNGLLGSIKEQRFKELWFSDKSRFFKINPSIHCRHHCLNQ